MCPSHRHAFLTLLSEADMCVHECAGSHPRSATRLVCIMSAVPVQSALVFVTVHTRTPCAQEMPCMALPRCWRRSLAAAAQCTRCTSKKVSLTSFLPAAAVALNCTAAAATTAPWRPPSSASPENSASERRAGSYALTHDVSRQTLQNMSRRLVSSQVTNDTRQEMQRGITLQILPMASKSGVQC